MKVLVIYEMFPEETIQAIVDMSEEEYNKFSVANNSIINGDNLSDTVMDINNAISNALCDKPEYLEYCDSDLDKEYFGCWSGGREESISDLCGVDKMIRCGIYL